METVRSRLQVWVAEVSRHLNIHASSASEGEEAPAVTADSVDRLLLRQPPPTAVLVHTTNMRDPHVWVLSRTLVHALNLDELRQNRLLYAVDMKPWAAFES